MKSNIIDKENEMPLISIIVPCYNCRTYINDCLESIRIQSYQNIEVICVNDGSTDNGETLKILRKFKKEDNRFIIIEEENGGVSVARNNGLKNAKGEYFCLVDQDDFLEKDFIAYLFQLIKDNNCEISTTPMPYKYNGKKRIKTEISNDEVKILKGEDAMEQMLYYNFFVAPWNKLISRNLIDKNNIKFNENFFGGEGFAFSIECFQAAKKVAVGSKCLYNYRVTNEDSGMTRFSLRVINSSLSAQKYIYDVVKNKEKYKNALRYANWHTSCDCFNFIVGCKVIDENRKLYNELKKVCKTGFNYAKKAPISYKEKMKAFLFLINPYLASNIESMFRKRKFTKNKKG